jgi:hypothetical protein
MIVSPFADVNLTDTYAVNKSSLEVAKDYHSEA